MTEEQTAEKNVQPTDTDLLSDSPQAPAADAPEQLGLASVMAQVKLVEKIVLLLVCAALATNVCLNIYLLQQNTSLKGVYTEARDRAQRFEDMERFSIRMIMDLRQLAGTDWDVHGLLVKYQEVLGTPPPPPETDAESGGTEKTSEDEPGAAAEGEAPSAESGTP